MMKTNTDIDESDARLESDEDAVKILQYINQKVRISYYLIHFDGRQNKFFHIEIQQENMRPLYVALTRASSRLYLYIREPDKKFDRSNIARISSDMETELQNLGKMEGFFYRKL